MTIEYEGSTIHVHVPRSFEWYSTALFSQFSLEVVNCMHTLLVRSGYVTVYVLWFLNHPQHIQEQPHTIIQ